MDILIGDLLLQYYAQNKKFDPKGAAEGTPEYAAALQKHEQEKADDAKRTIAERYGKAAVDVIPKPEDVPWYSPLRLISNLVHGQGDSNASPQEPSLTDRVTASNPFANLPGAKGTADEAFLNLQGDTENIEDYAMQPQVSPAVYYSRMLPTPTCEWSGQNTNYWLWSENARANSVFVDTNNPNTPMARLQALQQQLDRFRLDNAAVLNPQQRSSWFF